MSKARKPTRTRATPIELAEPLDQEDFHEATVGFRDDPQPGGKGQVLTTLITWLVFDGHRRRQITHRVIEGENAAHDKATKAFLASCVRMTPEDLI